MTVSERLVARLARSTERSGPTQLLPRPRRSASRRGFLEGAAVVGAALATNPWSYLVRPASAYAAVCGADSACADGYTVFCCTINAGRNSCPPDSFIGGWWKADNAAFCGGAARYYVDCNAYRDGHYTCHCHTSTTTCDQRRVACNQFRYGQCNLQIPYSSTGPVLCRLVSCVPPWQQYAGVCTSSSATDNQTVTHSAPCATGEIPVGHLDAVTTAGNVVYFTGWAYDPDQPGASISLALYEDGRGIAVYPANRARADVNASRHVTGRHGFAIARTTSTGSHKFTLYALNVAGGSGNPIIGGRTLSVNPGSAPRGHLDSMTTVANTVRIRGWAFDRDQPATSVRVVAYQDGRAVAAQIAYTQRPDVNAAFHCTGVHGFEITLSAANGPHEFAVRAVNVAGGAGNPVVGTFSMVVNPGAVPIGHLDSAKAIGTNVYLRGWAFDRDRLADPVQIVVHEDGQELSRHATDRDRLDVNAKYHINGARGFEIELATTAGLHNYAIYAINLGGGVGNLALGARALSVNQAAPLGTLDSVSTIAATIRVVGWAFDPDQPTTEISVALYLDGRGIRWFPTGVDRPDVRARYDVDGAHGFDFQYPVAPGPHTVAMYAINVGAAGPNPLIGQRTVLV